MAYYSKYRSKGIQYNNNNEERKKERRNEISIKRKKERRKGVLNSICIQLLCDTISLYYSYIKYEK